MTVHQQNGAVHDGDFPSDIDALLRKFLERRDLVEKRRREIARLVADKDGHLARLIFETAEELLPDFTDATLAGLRTACPKFYPQVEAEATRLKNLKVPLFCRIAVGADEWKRRRQESRLKDLRIRLVTWLAYYQPSLSSKPELSALRAETIRLGHARGRYGAESAELVEQIEALRRAKDMDAAGFKVPIEFMQAVFINLHRLTRIPKPNPDVDETAYHIEESLLELYMSPLLLHALCDALLSARLEGLLDPPPLPVTAEMAAREELTKRSS